MGTGMAGIPQNLGNPCEWVLLLQAYCRDGTKTCRNNTGMEIIAALNLLGVLGKDPVCLLDRPHLTDCLLTL